MISEGKLKTENAVSRRLFLKATFFFGLPVISHSIFTLFASKPDGTVSSYTRVCGHPDMGGDEFNSLKGLWIDSPRFTKAVRDYQRKGLILSFKQIDNVNGTSVKFVFSSSEAKRNFDDYLVQHKIFNEQKLLALGLVHETGIS